MSREELQRRMCRYTGVADQAVAAILEFLTYGAWGQSNPDLALQPIVSLNTSVLAMAPTMLMGSAMERNCSVLLNRSETDRATYTALSQPKEGASRNRLIEAISTSGFRFWFGRIPQWNEAAEIDLIIVSDEEACCLALELKSFIAPAEPREVRLRSEEIRKGVEQVQRRMEMMQRVPQPLLNQVGIDSRYRISWAVASDNSIGAGYVQSPDVPVVNAAHLAERLRSNPSLRACCDWLEAREFLPKPGVHYERIETVAQVGAWSLDWYSIKPLVSLPHQPKFGN